MLQPSLLKSPNAEEEISHKYLPFSHELRTLSLEFDTAAFDRCELGCVVILHYHAVAIYYSHIRSLGGVSWPLDLSLKTTEHRQCAFR